MQNLSEIRDLLAAAGVKANRRLGQNFLIDGNLMGQLLELAELPAGQTVLEVGAGMGSLTEELLAAGARVVAIELDRTLATILRRRLGGRDGLTILNCDVLAGKHTLAPEVTGALPTDGGVHLVSNLPYSVAVPVILNCLLSAWRAGAGEPAVRFDRLTVTVQSELTDRLSAGVGLAPDGPDPGGEYGPPAIIVALLGRIAEGRMLPPQAFWPRPKVLSQMLRVDFDADAASLLDDANELRRVLAATFLHRRKKLATTCRTKRFPYRPEAFLEALAAVEIDSSLRPHQVRPEQFRALANALRPRQDAANVLQ